MKVGLYFCTCGESYVSDFPFQVASCLQCRGDLKIEEHLTIEQIDSLTEQQVEHLWKIFLKLPRNHYGRITEEFLIWDIGAEVDDIFAWFNQRFIAKGTTQRKVED